MIIFHEGLPGAGKSYEAMLKHVIPALQKGRKCYARINGAEDPACRTKLAEVAGVTLEELDRLWVAIAESELQTVDAKGNVKEDHLPELIKDENCLVLLDEAQNFWPTGRQKLTPAMTKLITEHRHRGIDFLLMGQLLKDVHATWRGRVDQKVIFNTLDGVGLAKRYSVNVMKATAPEKFQTVVKTTGKYDPAFFGMYKSTVSSEVNTEKYKDPRGTVWAGWGMRVGIPLMLVVGVFAFWKAWGFFHPEPPPKAPSAVAAPSSLAAAAQAPVQPASAPHGGSADVLRSSGNFVVWVESLNKQYRPRLLWWYRAGKTEVGAIGWYDEAERVQESFTFAELRAQGVQVAIAPGSAIVGRTFATSWRPLEKSRAGYGADAQNGVAATTSGKAGLP